MLLFEMMEMKTQTKFDFKKKKEEKKNPKEDRSQNNNQAHAE